MTYLSLFSGIGGFELGIRQAHDNLSGLPRDGEEAEREGMEGVGDRVHPGYPQHPSHSHDTAYNRVHPGQVGEGGQADAPGDGGDHPREHRARREHRPVCAGFSEIDRYASSIYRRHFPHHEPLGDITEVQAEPLPDFDLLVGGFPCQAFSVAGKRLGFADTRGTLFFDIARILEAKRPRLLLLENVKGLLSHDGGRTFLTIVRTLDELGYDVQWQVLNSKNHGVPQNRERVFVVGHLRGTPRPEVFPLPGSDGAALPPSRERMGQAQGGGAEVAGCLGTRSGSGQSNFDASTTLVRVGTMRTYKDQEGFREMKKGVSPTLQARGRQDASGQPVVLTPGMQIRRLTPTECERLQGFPDGWTALGKDGEAISDTQRYKCLGNAVTVNVVRYICIKLLQQDVP